MPGHVCVENGPQPDQEFLDLIGEAVQENGDGDRCIPNGQNHLVIDMAPLYKAVIRKFLENEYPKIKSSFLRPYIHFRWQGAFLHQEGRIPIPSLPERALIIIPLMVRGDLRAQNNIILETGRSICVSGSTSLELVGPGTLLSIDLGFSR